MILDLLRPEVFQFLVKHFQPLLIVLLRLRLLSSQLLAKVFLRFVQISQLLEFLLICCCVVLPLADEFLELRDFDLLQIVLVLQLEILLLEEEVRATRVG